MANYRKAPRLYHGGSKDGKNFYNLPQKLMDCVFNELDGKKGNQIKLMTVLLGTAGNGEFGISEKWICARTGMDQPSYVRTRSALVEKGWLKFGEGSLYVDFEAIQRTAETGASPHASSMSSEQNACDDRMEKACCDDMYNTEKQINNNIKRIDNQLAVAPKKELGVTEKTEIPEYILKKMREIGIEFQQNSVVALEEVIGEKLDFYILNDLINRYRAEFTKARGKSEGYIFGILKKKVQTDYKKEKNKREAQRIADEQMREERKQYAMLMKAAWGPRADPKKQEGLGDISDLLDEML